MKSLNSRVNALAQLSKIADFKTRKSIGDGTSSAQLSQSSEKLSLVSFKNKLNPARFGSVKFS